MSIQRKTLLVTGTALVLGILMLYALLTSVVTFGFRQVEEAEALDEVHHVVDLLADDLENIERTNRDYSAWDDTYDYLADANTTYVEDNLMPATLLNLQINVMVFVRPDQTVLCAKAVDLRKGGEVPVPPGLLQALAEMPELTTHRSIKSRHAGVLALPEGPFLVVSLPVLTSEDEGPVRGALVMGRYYDAAMIKRAEDILGIQVSLRPFDDPDLPEDFKAARAVLGTGIDKFAAPIDASRFAGYAGLEDIHRRRAYLVRVIMGREIWGQGQTTLRYALLSLVAVSAIFSLATALVFRILILSRMRSLGVQVRALGSASATGACREIRVSGRDELSDLAGIVNETFQTLHQTEEALCELNADLEGRVVRRTAEVRDALAQVHALEAFKDEVIRRMLDGLCTFDEAGRVTMLNPAGASILATPEGAVGRSLAQVLGVDFADQVLSVFTRDAADGSPLEYLFGGAGREVRLLYSVAKMREGAADGAGAQGILTFWDITALRRAEGEVRRLERLAALGEVTAQVAHELRNPLTAMYSTMQCLTPLLREQDREKGALILDNMVRMEEIIRRMSLLAREIPLVSRRFDLRGLLDDCLALVDAALRERGVTVRASRPTAPLWIDGDRNQLHQVVLNLLMNATQAIPCGGTLSITLEGRGVEGAGTVVLTIEDSGPGVDAALVERIFDPFFTTKARGMGLGLSISERIVRAHGGTLTCANRPEGGAAFAIVMNWPVPLAKEV